MIQINRSFGPAKFLRRAAKAGGLRGPAAAPKGAPMLDAQNAVAAAPAVIRREDYRPPDWLVPEIALDFDLEPEKTVRPRDADVDAQRRARPRRCGSTATGQRPLDVRVDGARRDRLAMEDAICVIALAPATQPRSRSSPRSHPRANTQLMGLYASGGMLCTQCEAEGFRRITFFPDRPDVLARYRVRMTRRQGALSGAALQRRSESRAASSRRAALGGMARSLPQALLSVRAGRRRSRRQSRQLSPRCGPRGRSSASGCASRDLPRTDHAMDALKAAMKWDEEVYGREYDLDMFNIVAVADFNFGAMENKGLNIFNSRYILADPETATDADYDAIAAVVAHEYFHNWSGDRVTCRDWFQLSLKEGFTVFRDQSFSADMGSAAVKRIEDVRGAARRAIPRGCRPARASGAPRFLSWRSPISTPRRSTTRAPR